MNKYNVKIHIPTEQYGFVELDVSGSPEEISEAYNDVKSVFNASDGLDPKEWRGLLDRYLETGTMDSNLYSEMSPAQRYVVQEIKKSINRNK